MRLRNSILPSIIFLCCLFNQVSAQDSTIYSKLYNLPDKFFSRLDKKSQDIETKLSKQTDKYLDRLAKQEKKLQRKLRRKDSTAAKEIFGDVDARYAKLKSGLSDQNVYSGRLDSMQTALSFLQGPLSSKSSAARQQLQSVLGNYNKLQEKLNSTAAIKQQLKERQQYLKQHLQNFGLTKELRKYQKEVYYYRAQVDEYKRVWEDPSKLEAKLLQLANKIPAFKDFFKKHSVLASMFRLPGNDPAGSFTPIPGLQTRASIQQDMMQRFGSGPDVSRAMQQNIQSAQAQINQLKEKISSLGAGSSEADMPDFKPSAQKTKSFWNRIELGANFQSTKSSSFFPVTSDLALSAGYKLNDKSVIGLGASYKLGWGQGFRNIKLTHEGIGLRSFLDWKIKGSFYVSGGLEYNYQQPFTAMQQVYHLDSWQQSGLLGISKVVAVKTKFFKKTKVQLLWDFLSYEQVPRTQPIKFRVGYNL
jgi:hypothetical protein